MEPARNNLPIQLTSFIGREREIAEVKRLLTTTRLLTLTGAGGAGKTRLSLRVAAELRGDFSDGIWFIELAPLTDPHLVPQAIAYAMGLRNESARPILDMLNEHLEAKNVLLVLDNCEHLIDACAKTAYALLRHSPRIKILASSREALNISGETAYPVPPLSIPDPQHLPPPETLSQYEAVLLFVERALSAQPAFGVTNANAPAIAQICQRLDGIPLAIELAAARIKALKPEEIAARLDDSFHLLTGGSRTAPTRQQTLRAAMDWSYSLLSQPERVLWRRLSVFSGGATLEAVEQVCIGDGIAKQDVLDLLTRLTEKSILIVDTSGEATRYKLLEIIRQYANAKLGESGEHENAQNRHLDYFMQLAEQAEPKLVGSEQLTWFNRLDNEHDNLRTALNWSGNADRAEKGMRLGGSLYRFWLMRGFWREGYLQLDKLLKEEGAEKRTLGRGKALKVAGDMAGMIGAAKISQQLFAESISILREQGVEGRPWLENALGILAFLFVFTDLETAHAYAEETEKLCRESGNIPDLAQAFLVLGNVARWECDFPTALRHLEQTQELYQGIGDKRGMTAAINTLAWTWINQGDLDKAKHFVEQSLAISQEMGNKYHKASALMLNAIISEIRGRDEAEQQLDQAAEKLRELENNTYLSLGLSHLGRLHLKKKHFAAAHSVLSQSLVLSHKIAAKYFIPYVMDSFAFLFSAANQPQRAAQIFGATEALRDEFGTPLSPGYRIVYEPYLASTRARLDEKTFSVAWAEGRSMNLDQAMAFALEEIEIPETPDAPVPSLPQAAKEKYDGLTAREREVAALIALGKSNREIADTLVLSERTIEGHVSNILGKLGFNARSQIAVWVTQKGLENP